MKIKRIVILLVVFLSFFIISDKALAVHSSGGGSSEGGYHEGTPSYETYEDCIGKNDPNYCLDACNASSGGSGSYKCYRYFHDETLLKPAYFTTVWTNRVPSCDFSETDWTYEECKDGSLNNKVTVTYDDSSKSMKIAHSGYNGVPDFYDMSNRTEEETACNNFRSLHIIYRIITMGAPILAILFITFDFVKSIISGDPNKISNFRKKALRRIIALLILVLLPVITSTLVHMLSKNKKIATDSWIKCMVVGNSIVSSSSSESTGSNSVVVKKRNNTNKTGGNNDSDVVTAEGNSTRYNSASTSPNSQSTSPSKVYGATNSSEIISVSGTNYVVVKSKFPGGITAQAKSFAKEGIRQNYKKDGRHWGDCCWNMAHIHSCGVYKSAKLTLDSTKLRNRYTNAACANAPVNCGFSKVYSPSTETEFINYIVDKIQHGKPVVIRVSKDASKCVKKKKCKRHFLTVVGFKRYNPTSGKDLLVLDSYYATIRRMDKVDMVVAPCNILRNKNGCKGTHYYARAVK